MTSVEKVPVKWLRWDSFAIDCTRVSPYNMRYVYEKAKRLERAIRTVKRCL